MRASIRARLAWTIGAAVLLFAPGCSADSESPIEQAIGYFEWLATPPNSYKSASDGRHQSYSRTLFLNADKGEVAAFLDRHLESLSASPICRDCGLYAAAYASGRPELKRRAVGIVQGMIRDGLGVPAAVSARADRFGYVFDRLKSFAEAAPASDREAEMFGRLLAQSNPTPEEYGQKVRSILAQPWPSCEKKMAEAFIRQTNGQAVVDRWKRDEFDKTISRLRRVATERPDSSDTDWGFWTQDMQSAVRDLSNPDVRSLLSDGVDLVSKTRQFDDHEPLLAVAAFATGDPEIRRKVVAHLKSRIDSQDEDFGEVFEPAVKDPDKYAYETGADTGKTQAGTPRFNPKASRFGHYLRAEICEDLAEPGRASPADKEFCLYRAQLPQLPVPNNLRDVLVFNMIFNQINFMENRLKDAVVDLIAELNFDYAAIARELEYFANSQFNPARREAAAEIIRRMKGQAYLEEMSRAFAAGGLGKIVGREWRFEQQPEFPKPLSLLKKHLEGQSLNPNEYLQMEQFVGDLVAKASEESAVKTLSDLIGTQSSATGERPYPPLMLAAFASSDLGLKSKAQTVAELQILNAEGRGGGGVDGKDSAGKRFRASFEDIIGSIGGWIGPQAPESLYPLALDFLASLNLPYGLIKNDLEAEAARPGESLESRAALELIRRKKGDAYAAEVARREPAPKSGYNIFINGGYSPTSDNETNEADLISFYRRLFKSDAILFSGGGKNKFIPAGSRLIDRELGSDGHYEPATKENFARAVGTLVDRRPQELSIVFGGHGDKTDGFLLWNEETLSWNELRSLYSRFSPDTLIKSVILPCFGGTLVLPDTRQVPKRVGLLDRYLNFYYPKGRCSLAVSSGDELGQYYDAFQDWKSGSWSRAFNQDPDISMSKLQDWLYRDETLKVTPVSTLDYFRSDVASAICSEFDWISERRSRFGADWVRWPAEERQNARDSLLLRLDSGKFDSIQTFCAGYQNDAVYSSREENRRFLNQHEIELEGLLVRWSKELIHKKFPEFTVRSDWGRPKFNVEELFAKYVSEGRTEGLELANLHLMIEALSTPNLYAFRFLNLAAQSKQLIGFFNERFRQFLGDPENRRRYENVFDPESVSALLRKDYSRLSFADAFEKIKAKNEQLSSGRKNKEKTFREKQQKTFEAILAELESLKSVRPLYQSISSCESRPLRSR